jgi:hypothetical protein
MPDVTFRDPEEEEEEIQQDGIIFPFMNEISVTLHETKLDHEEFVIPVEIIDSNRCMMLDVFVRFLGNRWRFEIKEGVVCCSSLSSLE